MLEDVIKKKCIESQTSRDKYLARLLVFDRNIKEFESSTERLIGPYSEHWENLIVNCKAFKLHYQSLGSIYDGPEAALSPVLKCITTGKEQYPEDYLQQVIHLMDERSLMYRQIETELDERIEAVAEMKRLLISAEEVA